MEKIMAIRRPKCLKYYLPVSDGSKEWEKTRETKDEMVLGRKVFRRHILTNEEAKCSIYWLSPETSPKRHEREKADLGHSTSSTSTLSKALETTQVEKNYQNTKLFSSSSSSLANPSAPHQLEKDKGSQETYTKSTSLCSMVDEALKSRHRGSKQSRATVLPMKTLLKTSVHHPLDRHKTKTLMSNRWDLDEALHLPHDPYFLDQEEQEKIIHEKTLSHNLASKTSFFDPYSGDDSSSVTCQVSDDTSIQIVNPLIPLSIWRHRLRYNQPISFDTTSRHVPYKRIKSFQNMYSGRIRCGSRRKSYTTASSRRKKPID